MRRFKIGDTVFTKQVWREYEYRDLVNNCSKCGDCEINEVRTKITYRKGCKEITGLYKENDYIYDEPSYDSWGEDEQEPSFSPVILLASECFTEEEIDEFIEKKEVEYTEWEESWISKVRRRG